MKAGDTVMNDKEVENELEKHCYPSPKYWDEIDLVRKAQAEITWDVAFKAGYTQSVSDNDNWARETYGYKLGREELKKQVEGVKANAFSVSLFGDSNHQLKMDAMVSAYDVVLNKIKEMTK